MRVSRLLVAASVVMAWLILAGSVGADHCPGQPSIELVAREAGRIGVVRVTDATPRDTGHEHGRWAFDVLETWRGTLPASFVRTGDETVCSFPVDVPAGQHMVIAEGFVFEGHQWGAYWTVNEGGLPVYFGEREADGTLSELRAMLAAGLPDTSTTGSGAPARWIVLLTLDSSRQPPRGSGCGRVLPGPAGSLVEAAPAAGSQRPDLEE